MTPDHTTSATDVARYRLAHQSLTGGGPGFENASDVVRALGAVQAQDYLGAKWALSQRTTGATDTEIERELTDGRIIRTHVLRPTWHFVAPEDLRWMLALTAPRVKALMAYYNRQLELTPAIFRRSHAAIVKALEGGKQLTRAELRQFLERARIGAVTGQRLGHLMMEAELDAVVCSGSRRGKQFTYALVEDRVPCARTLDRDEALLELTRRYFTTRGPATAQDFAWWSGLAMADVKRGIEIAGQALQTLTSDDRTHWLNADASPPRRSSSAHLLPNYDEYFIGFKNRSAIGQRLGHTKTVTGGSALTAHVVVVDGQLVGGWRRTREPRTIGVQLLLLTKLSDAERRRVAAAAKGFGEFSESVVELRGLR